MSNNHLDAEFLDRNPYPERGFTLFSLILGIFGAVVSGWTIFDRNLPGWFILIKDIAIYGTLLTLTLFFFLKYRQAVGEVSRQRRDHASQMDTVRQIVNRQVEVYHQLMDHTRGAFYGNAVGSIYDHRFNYIKPKLNDLLETSLHSVLSSVGALLRSHMRAKGLSEIPKLSLSVKAFVTGAMVKDLCSLSEDIKRGISDDEKYIITLERDAETKLYNREREVKQNFYNIKENTEFYRISPSDLAHFFSNDLSALDREGDYKNSNKDWRKQYNATQAVPIWHSDANNTNVFGFLTVDSLNQSAEELFDRKWTKSIMMFGADLLALLFLTLDMYDQLPLEAKTENIV